MKQLRLLRDIEVVGVKHEKGTVFTLDGDDRIYKDRVEMMIGHGENWGFYLGKDAELVQTEGTFEKQPIIEVLKALKGVQKKLQELISK